MKRIAVPFIAALLMLGITTAHASNVGVDLNVQIGTPPQPPPTRVIVRESAPPPSTIYIEDDVDFVYPSQLGFYVGVGLQDDLFFLNNLYFTYRSGTWYKSHNHRSGWVAVERNHLPPGLRKHKLERIRYYRDREFQNYEREGDHYRGRHARSERGEWKGHRKSEKEYRKEEKRRDKNDRKEERTEEKQYEKGNRGHGNDREGKGHGGDR